MRRTSAQARCLPISKSRRAFPLVSARGAHAQNISPTSTPCTTIGSAKKRVLRGHGYQPAILDAFPSIFEKQPLGAGPWRRIVITL